MKNPEKSVTSKNIPSTAIKTTSLTERLLDATDDLIYKAMFATMYSSEMRVSEVIQNLVLLMEYWLKKSRPKGILFSNRFTGQYEISQNNK